MKPLHARVAKALGCKPDFHEGHGWWLCGCGTPEHVVAEERLEGPPILQHFDTDWAATGPLVEKYRVKLRPAAGRCWGASIPDDLNHGQEYNSQSALVAVCECIIGERKAGRLKAAA